MGKNSQTDVIFKNILENLSSSYVNVNTDIKVAFLSDFYHESYVLPKAKNEIDYCNYFCEIFKKNLKTNIRVNTRNLDISSLPSNIFSGVGPTLGDKYTIAPAYLSQDNNDFTNQVVQTCSLVSSPQNFIEFMNSCNVLNTFYENNEIDINPNCNFIVRVLKPNLSYEFEPLAFALNLDDMDILKKYNTNRMMSGEEGWIVPSLKERIIKAYLLNSFKYSSETPIEKWINVLSDIANNIIQDDALCLSKVSKNFDYIDFVHIGGEKYMEDLLLIEESVFKMISAVDVSINKHDNSIWDRFDMLFKVKELISEILSYEELIPFLKCEEKFGYRVPTFNIVNQKTSSVIATLSCFNNDTTQKSNSIISLGSMSDFCVREEEIYISSLLLFKRNSQLKVFPS